MSALDWRHASIDRRTADGRYGGWFYELERVHPRYTLPYWVARFYDGTGNRPQMLADRVNFIQARQVCIAHHKHPGY